MRPDAKLGVVISAIIVLVAGSYYLYRDRNEKPIAMAGGPQTTAQPTSQQKKATRSKSSPTRLADRSRREPTRPLDAATGSGSPSTRRASASKEGTRAKRMADRSSGFTGNVAGHKGDAATPKTISPATVRSDAPDNTEGKGALTDRRETSRSRGSKIPLQTGAKEGSLGPPQTLAKFARKDQRKGGQPTKLEGNKRSRRNRTRPLVAKKSASSNTAGAALKPITPNVAVETHRVQPGDTMSSLAESYYGSAKQTGYLIASNPQIEDPDRLSVGMVVKIPPAPPERGTAKLGAAKPSAPKTAGARTYTVKPGDSFYAIARDALGDSSRWQELFELNRDLVHGDPKRLQVGSVIRLPDR